MGSSRYDKTRPVGDREAAEARALHVIGDLVGDYPGISSRDVAGQVAPVPWRQDPGLLVGAPAEAPASPRTSAGAAP